MSDQYAVSKLRSDVELAMKDADVFWYKTPARAKYPATPVHGATVEMVSGHLVSKINSDHEEVVGPCQSEFEFWERAAGAVRRIRDAATNAG